MLNHEFDYYLAHQAELVKQYNGKYLIIKNQSIKAALPSIEEATKYGNENFKPGTYLIQKCSPGDNDYTQTFHSRVIFA